MFAGRNMTDFSFPQTNSVSNSDSQTRDIYPMLGQRRRLGRCLVFAVEHAVGRGILSKHCLVCQKREVWGGKYIPKYIPIILIGVFILENSNVRVSFKTMFLDIML